MSLWTDPLRHVGNMDVRHHKFSDEDVGVVWCNFYSLGKYEYFCNEFYKILCLWLCETFWFPFSVCCYEVWNIQQYIYIIKKPQ
jgi:hypothetical protein